MRHFCFTYFLILLLAALSSACGTESSGSAADTADGDLVQDGDMFSDGDSAVAGTCSSSEDCEDGLICDPVTGVCSEPECRQDAECRELYDDESYCSDEGFCVNGTCFGSQDCSHGTYCSTGYCRPLPTCDRIADARIMTSLPLIRAGKEVGLKAAAYDDQGVVLPSLNGLKFEWESMNSEIVAVDAITGVATGGKLSGTTTIMMHLRYSDPACAPYEITDTMSMQNFAAYDEGVRVVVIDSASDQPVGGAVVSLNGVNVITSSDADAGVALFEGAEAPYTVHVFHEHYHYFSIIGISGKDILIPLEAFDGPNRSAGIRGNLDYSGLDEKPEGSYNFGIAGTSFSNSLISSPVDMLFSSPVLKNIPLGMLNQEESLLPSNIELFGDTSNSAVSSSYLADGRSGLSVAWAWAGFIPTEDVKEVLSASLDNEWDAWGALLFATLSFSENFYHGMLADVELQSASMVPDNGSFNKPPYDRSDLNGNGDPEDLIPDYHYYTDLGSSLKPEKPMNRRIKVSPGFLPTFGQDHLDGTLVVLGSNLPGGDFIPLGVGVGDESVTLRDDDDSEGDNAEIIVNFTPYYGGLSDRYTLISYAVPASKSQESLASGPVHSAVIHRFSGKTKSVKLPDYLDIVPFASYDESSRTVIIYAGEGADMYRVVFSSNGRRWDLLADTGYLKELDMMELTLPVPVSDDPCGSSMSVYAVDLSENYSLDSLAAFDDKTLLGVDQVTDRISVYNYSKKKK